jgi:hypothetical protein
MNKNGVILGTTQFRLTPLVMTTAANSVFAPILAELIEKLNVELKKFDFESVTPEVAIERAIAGLKTKKSPKQIKEDREARVEEMMSVEEYKEKRESELLCAWAFPRGGGGRLCGKSATHMNFDTTTVVISDREDALRRCTSETFYKLRCEECSASTVSCATFKAWKAMVDA